MRQWSDLPPDMNTIIRRTQELKLAGMIYVCFLTTGETQVSIQRGSSDKPIGAIDKDPIMAFLKALGPPEGGSWAEHLQLTKAKPTSVPKVKPKKSSPPPEDDDDYMDVV